MARVAQVRSALQEAARRGGPRGHALVLAGDMNAPLISSAVASYLSFGAVVPGVSEFGMLVDVGKICAESGHPYSMTSAYTPDPNEFSFTLRGAAGHCHMLDQIWFDSTRSHCQGLRNLFRSDEHKLAVLNRGLPHAEDPSDHLPVGVILKVLPPAAPVEEVIPEIVSTAELDLLKEAEVLWEACPLSPEQRSQYLRCEEVLREATPVGKPSAEELAAYEAAQRALRSLLESLPEECQQILQRVEELKKQARKAAKRSAKDKGKDPAGKKSMPRTELFWALLEGDYPLEELKKVNLEGFDWSGRRKDGKTLLVARIGRALCCTPKFEEALNTIEWLICSGASIEQTCTGGHYAIGWPNREETEIRFECEGRSAISFVQTLQVKMRQNLSAWTDQDTFLTKVMSLFIQTPSPNEARRRVSIDEGIAELWEKSLAAKDSHDLTIETADGPVTAHAHMLKAASSVVTAMLESPMKEGKTQRIEIKDMPGKAVSLFVEILYTCSAQDEPDHETASHALDLAHRWQVEVVVAILTDLLAGMITDGNFLAIAEHAVLKGLDRLKTAAKSFGAGSTKVQADLKEGRLPTAVLQLFPAAPKPSKPDGPKPKRRRM
ncbi:unnamed protein product [Cladocopium goreaui]|nr:unnamed protein product [Cladocopium goreaui]